MGGKWGGGGRLFEVGANSRLGAYSNKYGNSDLNEICRWCCHNSLLMNPDKTKLLVIGAPQLLRQLPDFTITLRQTNIIDTCSKGSWNVFRSVPLL